MKGGEGGTLWALLPRRRTRSVTRTVVALRLGVPVARLRVVVLPRGLSVDIPINGDGLGAEIRVVLSML